MRHLLDIQDETSNRLFHMSLAFGGEVRPENINLVAVHFDVT